MHALVVDDHDLPRFDVTDEVGVDDIERAGLAGEHPSAGALCSDAAQDEGPNPQRIAHAHQGFVGKSDQGIGADHLLQRVDQPVHDGGVEADGDQVDEDLGIRG